MCSTECLLQIDVLHLRLQIDVLERFIADCMSADRRVAFAFAERRVAFAFADRIVAHIFEERLISSSDVLHLRLPRDVLHLRLQSDVLHLRLHIDVLLRTYSCHCMLFGRDCFQTDVMHEVEAFQRPGGDPFYGAVGGHSPL